MASDTDVPMLKFAECSWPCISANGCLFVLGERWGSEGREEEGMEEERVGEKRWN